MRWSREVFLSHTTRVADEWLDEARQAIHFAKDVPVDMSIFGSDPNAPAGVCEEQVRGADIFVSLVGDNAGSLRPGHDETFCEFEYRIATQSGARILVFLLPGARGTTDDRQARFVERLQANHTVVQVESPATLGAHLVRSLLGPTRETPGDIDPREQRFRRALVDEVVRVWVDEFRAADLTGTVQLPLTYQQRAGLFSPKVVVGEWAAPTPAAVLDPDALPGGHATRLLLLGRPGSGKTTYLVRLAARQLGRSDAARDDELPVILNLSTWTPRIRSLRRWLERELQLKYRAERRQSRAWLDRGSLFVLLDGLDEVPEPHRDACVRSVNAFMASHGHIRIVVASRTGEYDLQRERLEIPTVAEIQPLDLGAQRRGRCGSSDSSRWPGTSNVTVTNGRRCMRTRSPSAC